MTPSADNPLNPKQDNDANGKKVMSKTLRSERPAHDSVDSTVEHRERMLDDALTQSFPASDPPSIYSASDWSGGISLRQRRRQSNLDKGVGSSIFKVMSERSQFGRPQLHPGSSTARF